jgi:tRNA(Ile)-lysidine synthase
MPAEAGDLVRPLLGVTRDETAAYCQVKGIEPRQDSTNADERLLRNRVRRSLLPLLERDYRRGSRQALLRLAEIAEAELAWMRLRVLREAAAEVRGGLHDLGLEHVQALEALALEGRTGARAELPGLWAERTADTMALRPGARREAAGYEASLRIPGEAVVPAAGLAMEARLLPVADCDPGSGGVLVAHLDAEMAGRQVVIRSPRAGDRLAPLGLGGTKKLHEFLADRKIPRAEREGISVVATTEGEILWVVGHGISERAKVTAATRQVAELVARRLA